MNITCTKAELDDDDEFLPAFYMQFVTEDPDFEYDMGFSTGDLNGIKDYFRENRDVSEMTKTVQIGDDELSKLESYSQKNTLFESVLKECAQ